MHSGGRAPKLLLLVFVAIVIGNAAMACSFRMETIASAPRKPSLLEVATSGGPLLLVRLVRNPDYGARKQVFNCGKYQNENSLDHFRCVIEFFERSEEEPFCLAEVIDEINVETTYVTRKLSLSAPTNCNWRPDCRGETVVLPVTDWTAGGSADSGVLGWRWSAADWEMAKRSISSVPSGG